MICVEDNVERAKLTKGTLFLGKRNGFVFSDGGCFHTYMNFFEEK